MDKKIFFSMLSGVLFILLPLLFWGGPDWVSPPIYQHIWDFGHIVFFALVGAFIQHGVGTRNFKRWVIASSVILIVGIVIELVQKQVGRTASAMDVFNDLAGFWLGLAWAGRDFFKPWVVWVKTALVIPALLSICMAIAIQSQQALAFPLLAGFENGIELQRMRGSVSPDNAFYRQGERSLKINFSTKKYSGIYLTLFHGDWSAYSHLAMDFYNPDSVVLPVMLRISDRTHDRGKNDYDDRFNRRLYLEPGWSSVRVSVNEIKGMPTERDMVMNEIHTLGVYTSYLTEPRVLYWDNVRLE